MRKYSKIIHLLTVIIGFGPLTVFCQDTVSTDKPTDARSLMLTYYDEDFHPFKKRNWYVSFETALDKQDLTNERHILENVIDGHGSNYNIGLSTGYYFSDNYAAGIGFNFSESQFNGDVLGTTVLSRNDTINKNSISNQYSILPHLRSSIPLSANQRLNIFIDLGFSVGWGNTVTRDYNSNGSLSKSYADNLSFGVGVSPGITFFAMQNFAIELGLSLIGYNYKVKNTTVDDLPESVDVKQSIDFNLSLLRLNVALTYYIIRKK